jgi:hypothetical protein
MPSGFKIGIIAFQVKSQVVREGLIFSFLVVEEGEVAYCITWIVHHVTKDVYCEDEELWRQGVSLLD